MKAIVCSREKAFSLLELLVVMGIISILFAIMVPSMFHFIQYVRHLGRN